jgi:hypothetical protein
LYAYLHAKSRSILYLGKCDGTSVRKRVRAADKKRLFDYLTSRCQVQSLRIAVGAVYLEEGYRMSRQLLADIESLLINRVKPIGNVSAVQDRVARPGLRVKCSGAWHFDRSVFVDAS